MIEKLRTFCKSININSMGIASAQPFYDFEDIWRKQIDKGYISGFEEKDINKRIYPKLTLESAQSLIVCLFPYYAGEIDNANISKSAFSIDYHIIVKDKLEEISAFLSNNIKNFEYKAFVDTGPFSDRYLAYKAGLGFWGINNNLITDQYGSYFFIGYILNNYPFEADKPMNRTCIQCNECIKKCPGQCILGDFTINPQKCKSYISQKKKPLDKEDKEILQKTSIIWGCDVCQDVCPHNKNARVTVIKEFTENLLPYLNYHELSQMSNREFKKIYGNRSFSWRGKNILKRNHEITNDILSD